MLKKAIIASAVALASVGSFAAQAPLTVTGTITPEACAITLGNGGAVDYGTVSSVTVKSYGLSGSGTPSYAMPIKTTALNVTCSAPTAVAMNFTDNRASSSYPINTGITDPGANGWFGLGMSGTSKIGLFSASLTGATVTTTVGGTASAPAGALVRAKNTTGAWTGGGLSFNTTNAIGMKATAAETTPTAITAIAGTVNVQAYANKATVDAATTSITLDGSVTIALEYI